MKHLEITGITHESYSVWVGRDGVTEIKKGYENGHMAKITVYHVMKGELISETIYPHGHHIKYKTI